jgi:hypothetical protein
VGNTYVGAVQFISDYRIKKGVKPLPSMWEKLKALKPISYSYRDFTPPCQLDKDGKQPAGGPFFRGDKKERWGFIAHELQELLIEDAASSVKDAPDALQSPNPWTLIALLTRTMQEAVHRIEALEASPKAATRRH